jgi:hypothetical protein
MLHWFAQMPVCLRKCPVGFIGFLHKPMGHLCKPSGFCTQNNGAFVQTNMAFEQTNRASVHWCQGHFNGIFQRQMLDRLNASLKIVGWNCDVK